MPREKKLVLLIAYWEEGDIFLPVFSQSGLYAIRAYAEKFPEISSHFEFRHISWSVGAKRKGLEIETRDIVAYILKHRPAMICFSLDVSTLLPVHYLATCLKEIVPDLIVVAGGPEVVEREEFVERYPEFDIIVEGVGGVPFRHLLERVGSGKHDFTGIPNLSFRTRHGEVVHNSRVYLDEELISQEKIFSEANRELRGYAFYMTTSGCPNRCSYCTWAYRKQHNKPASLIRPELNAMLASGGINKLFLMDSDILRVFQKRPRAYAVLRETLQNNGRPPTAILTTPAGLVHSQIEQIISDLNVEEIFIGIQSMTPSVLRAVNRGWQIAQLKYLPQVPRSLRRKVVPQLMVPLPEEDPGSFYAGIEQLFDWGYLRLQVFSTMVLPGSRLKVQAPSLGLRYHSTPPYHCFETPTFPTAAVAEAQVCGEILTDITYENGIGPDETFLLVEQLHANHPEICRYIRDKFREFGSVAECRKSLISEMNQYSYGG